eukprot:2428480-Pyramimonas_sp.AAC.1
MKRGRLFARPPTALAGLLGVNGRQLSRRGPQSQTIRHGLFASIANTPPKINVLLSSRANT